MKHDASEIGFYYSSDPWNLNKISIADALRAILEHLDAKMEKRPSKIMVKKNKKRRVNKEEKK